MRKDLQELWLLAEPYVRDAGFDLVEVTFGREATGWVLRLFIDKPLGPEGAAGEAEGATAIGHKECERVSRDVSAALDVADKIPHAYQLEVSSPGLDRPLRRPKDFARFVGENARIRLAEGKTVDGRRNFSGIIRAVNEGCVEIECDGRSYPLPIDDIAKANLVPNWEREFRRAGAGELRSSDPIAGGAGPSQGPASDRAGAGELRSSDPIAGGTGPSQGPASDRSAS